jgi:hypothetical protein
MRKMERQVPVPTRTFLWDALDWQGRPIRDDEARGESSSCRREKRDTRFGRL